MKYILALVLLIVLIGGGYYWWMRDGGVSDDPNARYEVRSQSVSYFENAQGYYVAPTAEGNFPGVVMIHEWWGLNDQMKTQAEILANLGYRVLAVDLYGGRVAATSSEAQQMVQSLDQAKATENLKAAAQYLRDQGSRRVAGLGWCFGGGQSLQLALSGEDLDATVIYYGNLVTDAEQLKKIEWPVLGIFGAEDQSISTTSVAAFEQALKDAGVENQIYLYPGVGHAFANPTRQGYAPAETADAWSKTTAFLREQLK